MRIGEPLGQFEVGFPLSLRERWRTGVQPCEWFMQYASLFDGSDLEIAVSQPAAHFAEWLVAIELSRRGLHVLVEKWDSCTQHPRKCLQARALLGSEGLDWFRTGAAGADLFVFDDSGRRFFVEVKLLPDQLKERQNTSFDVFDRVFRVPWFRIDARADAMAGLSDAQFNNLLDALSLRLALRSQPPSRGNPSIPQYPVGSSRPVRCHIRCQEHAQHATTAHMKAADGTWRCESCGTVKTRATIVDIVARIQLLKERFWEAGGSRRHATSVPRASLPESVKELEREWHRYARDHIDLSWIA